MNCRNCGIKIPDNYLKLDGFRCPKCGRRYQRMPNPSRQKPVSSTMARKTVRPSQNRLAKGKTIRFCALIVVLIFVVIISIISIVDSNRARDMCPCSSAFQRASWF